MRTHVNLHPSSTVDDDPPHGRILYHVGDGTTAVLYLGHNVVAAGTVNDPHFVVWLRTLATEANALAAELAFQQSVAGEQSA